MPSNLFPRHGSTYQFYEFAELATISDSVELPNYARAFYVNVNTTGKTATVITVGGKTIALKNLIVGTIYPISIKQILSTGTTVDEIVVLW